MQSRTSTSDSSSDFVLFPFTNSDSPEMMAVDASRFWQMAHLLDPLGIDPFSYHAMDQFNSLVQNQHDSSASLQASSSSYYDPNGLYMESNTGAMNFPPAPSTPSSMATCQSSEVMPPMSCASVPSASSSAIGSPYTGAAQGFQEPWIDNPSFINGLSPLLPEFIGCGVDPETPLSPEKYSANPHNFVDPSLLQSVQRHPTLPTAVSYPEESSIIPHPFASPSLSASPLSASPLHTLQHQHQHQHQHQQQQQQQQPGQVPISSPYTMNFPSQPGQLIGYRRPSVSSTHSGASQQSPRISHGDGDEEGREKGRCLECGRVFKDLKAHMLTHLPTRPEKCPIVNCEYHLKGFARKYDKNRHTLTHYKGTMVCGFCPGSGSSAEKSFNRADVFKRHLTSVHGVEQNPPNCRKRSPTSSSGKKLSGYSDDATGKCSTCSTTFSNAQDFYEHLDDCVLRVVQQEEPSEAINQQHLAEMASDEEVKKTMEKHMLADTAGSLGSADGEEYDNDDDDDDDDDEDNDFNDSTHNLDSRSGKSSLKSNKPTSRAVLGNHSAVTKPSASSAIKARPSASRKRKNHTYPQSWGCQPSKLKTKKRLLCVFEGRRPLWKDEMMLDNDFEVRLRLPGGAGDGTPRGAYVTDLDVETLKRANGVLDAAEEEKGPWMGGSSNRLIGQPAMLLPEISASQVGEVNIDQLMA